MQIRPTAFTIGLIIHSFITLFFVYTEFGIGSTASFKLNGRIIWYITIISPKDFSANHVGTLCSKV